MTIPDWKTFETGARVRVAIWLHTEVGEGGVFTKAQLRRAFPAVEQVDRRMRDLRPEGWIIATYREDRSLTSDELRLVRIGGPVWLPHYRSKQSSSISDKERQELLAHDNYSCVYCGIGAGEPYSDDPSRTAKLTVARVSAPASSSGSGHLATACDRCHVATREMARDTADAVIRDLAGLDQTQLTRLRGWVQRDRRVLGPEHDLWARYRRLPWGSRDAVRDHLLRE